MAEITACPSCGKQNRVPSAATGKPTCGACGAPLPWIVDATEATFDDTVATTVRHGCPGRGASCEAVGPGD